MTYKKKYRTLGARGIVDMPPNPEKKYRRKNIEYLPEGDVIFKKYFQEMGTARSLKKVREWLVSEGYTNPVTGKAPAPMAPWWRMWRWALSHKNFQIAYEIYNTAMADEGKFVTPEEFRKYLDDKALTVFNFIPKDYKAYLNGKF